MATDASGTTLMDLITADPSTVPPPPPTSNSGASAGTLGKPVQKPPTYERKTKRGTLMQIQNDTITVAKSLNPVKSNIMAQKEKRKPVSYSQLARSIHELVATSNQKSAQKQLVHQVLPKLAVYNSVDPSVAPSLLMLNLIAGEEVEIGYEVDG